MRKKDRLLIIAALTVNSGDESRIISGLELVHKVSRIKRLIDTMRIVKRLTSKKERLRWGAPHFVIWGKDWGDNRQKYLTAKNISVEGIYLVGPFECLERVGYTTIEKIPLDGILRIVVNDKPNSED